MFLLWIVNLHQICKGLVHTYEVGDLCTLIFIQNCSRHLEELHIQCMNFLRSLGNENSSEVRKVNFDAIFYVKNIAKLIEYMTR